MSSSVGLTGHHPHRAPGLVPMAVPWLFSICDGTSGALVRDQYYAV